MPLFYNTFETALRFFPSHSDCRKRLTTIDTQYNPECYKKSIFFFEFREEVGQIRLFGIVLLPRYLKIGQMNFDVACYSEQGGRPVNEDAVFAAGTPGTLLALVADGLGGMGHGDLASRDAAEHLSRLSAHPVDEDMLCGAIQEENRRIWDMHTDGNQMMTTVAVLWADGTEAFAANVGDTRLYQFRNGQVAFQTIDHSVAQLSVFSGEITQAQLRGYAGRNHLLRALGAEEEVQVELNDLEIQPGDRFLLCSDGFWELILEEEMLSWGGEDTAAQWLERMKALAISRCGAQGDNHSAIAIVVTEGTEDAN